MATVNGTRKEPDYTAERLVMIRAQLQRRGIADTPVPQAMQALPRPVCTRSWRFGRYATALPLPMTRRSRSPIWSLL
jgi:hypothetical protein